MITRPKKIYFVTDDTRNHKNKTLIDLLKIEFKDEINIISPSYSKKNQFGLPQIFIKTNQRLKSFMFYWSKISFLISKIKNTSSDIYFPERNIYSGNSLIRFFINKLWRFKRLKFINEILPNYDSVLFFPLSFYRKKIKSKDRLFILDSLSIRYSSFSDFIKIIFNSKCEVLFNVASWDNPFYSQFFSEKQKYIVWSENMLIDIKKVHNIDFENSNNYKIGPYPFYSFFSSRNNYKEINYSNKLCIGYACAFCDSYMMNQEFLLINKIAKKLSDLNVTLLIRPYPSIPIEEYQLITLNENVILYEPKKIAYVDRFGDGREKIFFSSDEERHDYNNSYDIFLSIATSFTIESAIDRKPIIQLYLDKDERNEIFEKEVFLRFDISDHLKKYYLKNIKIVRTFNEFNGVIKKLLKKIIEK